LAIPALVFVLFVVPVDHVCDVRALAGLVNAPLLAGLAQADPAAQPRPPLVHACLFGASYAGQVRAAALGCAGPLRTR